MHVNLHEFKLQFKTITFLATFGLLLSIFTVGFAASYFVGLPLGVGLLFGAMISATDPIAVLVLFKHLGAPKRLGLLAEGESMFNDATAVITFRLIASFVVANQYFEASRLITGIGDFFFIFAGSIFTGALLGWLTSLAIGKIKNDPLSETTLTLALALGSFVFAEHYLHLSGVITTVIAGIVLGNYGKAKISANVVKFIEDSWEYLAFLTISLIFFFTAFNLHPSTFTNPTRLLILITIILVARAISVYFTFALTNTLPFFKNEPNVLLSWQHIINWGGLRGVIPLVLVFSLPDTFAYKQDALSLSFAVFLFTLFINGLTIKALLTYLGVHLPKKEEAILKEEANILELELAREKLASLPKQEFSPKLVSKINQELTRKERFHHKKLLKLATTKDLTISLKLESIHIERKTYQLTLRT